MTKINRIAAALLVTAALAGCATEADDDTETPTEDVTTETESEGSEEPEAD